MPDGATKKNALATKGLEYCSRLFEVEQTLESLPDADRQNQRQFLSKPIVDEYYTWLGTIFRPAGKLKKAVTYSLNQREYLCALLDHGETEISNNQVENAIRPIVVGRKNWLFCDTQAGANASVIIFTVLETAKANGLNPEAYLNHLLTVLPGRFAADPQAAVDDLMPWDEKIQRCSDAQSSSNCIRLTLSGCGGDSTCVYTTSLSTDKHNHLRNKPYI